MPDVAIRVVPVVPDVRYAGTVKWFDAAKGWGFITPGERIGALAERDLFVHSTALNGLNPAALSDGAHVSFAVGEHRGRPTAVAVLLEP